MAPTSRDEGSASFRVTSAATPYGSGASAAATTAAHGTGAPTAVVARLTARARRLPLGHPVVVVVSALAATPGGARVAAGFFALVVVGSFPNSTSNPLHRRWQRLELPRHPTKPELATSPADVGIRLLVRATAPANSDAHASGNGERVEPGIALHLSPTLPHASDVTFIEGDDLSAQLARDLSVGSG